MFAGEGISLQLLNDKITVARMNPIHAGCGLYTLPRMEELGAESCKKPSFRRLISSRIGLLGSWNRAVAFSTSSIEGDLSQSSIATSTERCSS